MTINKLQDTYIFWPYDLFPYLIGAEAIGIDTEGYFRAVGFNGYRFKPKYVMNLKSGKEVQKKLDSLKAEKSKEENDINDKYKKKLEELFLGHK